MNAAMTLFETIGYNEWVKADENVEVMYTNAGHLIESAAINLKVQRTEK